MKSTKTLGIINCKFCKINISQFLFLCKTVLESYSDSGKYISLQETCWKICEYQTGDNHKNYKDDLLFHDVFLEMLLTAHSALSPWQVFFSLKDNWECPDPRISQLHVIVVVVHEAGHVQEGLDAVDVRADGLEVAVFADACLGTEVAQEELPVHLLAVDTGPQTAGVRGPAGAGAEQARQ